jgi:uncharacterized protein with NAD-binding domain and iron-sulfur cluster
MKIAIMGAVLSGLACAITLEGDRGYIPQYLRKGATPKTGLSRGIPYEYIK